jgi:hypothetical protein
MAIHTNHKQPLKVLSETIHTVFAAIGCMIIREKIFQMVCTMFYSTLCLDGERFFTHEGFEEKLEESNGKKNPVNIFRAFTFREVCSPASSFYRATYEVLTFSLNVLRYRSIPEIFYCWRAGIPPPTIQPLSICAFYDRFVVCVL